MRASRRLKVFQPATLDGPIGSARIHLLDVSASGARGHMANPPSEGDRVVLACEGLSLQAVVRWRTGSRFGLAFDAPLSEAQLILFTRTGTTRASRP